MAGYCEKVAALQDRRAGLYHALEEALLRLVFGICSFLHLSLFRLKANKEVASFHNTLKRIGGNCKKTYYEIWSWEIWHRRVIAIYR